MGGMILCLGLRITQPRVIGIVLTEPDSARCENISYRKPMLLHPLQVEWQAPS